MTPPVVQETIASHAEGAIQFLEAPIRIDQSSKLSKSISIFAQVCLCTAFTEALEQRSPDFQNRWITELREVEIVVFV